MNESAATAKQEGIPASAPATSLDDDLIDNPLQRTEFRRISARQAIHRYQYGFQCPPPIGSKTNTCPLCSIAPSVLADPPKFYHAIKQLALSLADLSPRKLYRIIVHKLSNARGQARRENP